MASFLKLQIPFLIRHRVLFGDLETWIVWGNIAVSHQYYLSKAAENNLIQDSRIDFTNYYKNVVGIKIERGINASSIADISTIPRATVIRKLKWLADKDVIKKNKNLEYVMQNKGKMNKKIADNFMVNQIAVAEFLTDIFDYIKIPTLRFSFKTEIDMEIATTLAPVALAVIMLGLGLGLEVKDFARVIKNPKDFFIGFTCQVILLPIIAFIIINIVPIPLEIALGVMIIAAAPGGVTSNILTKFANGDVALSVSLTVLL